MTELMYDGPASLTIYDGDISADYNGGIVRLVKGNLEAAEDERVKSFLHFSTPDVPSLYVTEIDKDRHTLVSFLLPVSSRVQIDFLIERFVPNK